MEQAQAVVKPEGSCAVGSRHQKPVIVVDVGGVLIDYDLDRVFEALSRRLNIPLPLLSPVDLDRLFHPLVTGTGDWKDVLPGLDAALGIRLSPGEWHTVCSQIFIGEVPGMDEALAELKSDYRLIALSNTMAVHWTHLMETYSIFRHLDGWVLSYLEGTVKPRPEIYARLQRRYCGNAPPFFFTDDTRSHVQAARRLGWHAAVFCGADDFMENVRRHRAEG